MALVVVMFSSLLGMIASLVALFAFGVSLPQALALYLVSSIVPVALVLAGVYLHMLITRAMAAHQGTPEAHRAHR